jgi:hypothetical protein
VVSGRPAGYALQVAGLLVVGAGLFVGLGRGDVKAELLLLAAGAGAFLLGRFIGRGPGGGGGR